MYVYFKDFSMGTKRSGVKTYTFLKSFRADVCFYQCWGAGAGSERAEPFKREIYRELKPVKKT